MDIDAGDFVEGGIFPRNPHYCEAVDVNSVRGQEIKRTNLANVKITRSKPAAVIVSMSSEVATRYAHLGDDVIQDVRQAAMKTKTSVAKAVQRVRQTLYPKVDTLPELDAVEPNFLLTIIGEELQDSNDKHLLWKSDSAAILGCNYFIEAIKERVTELFLDGTYKFCPKNFYQLYRIFGLTHDTVNVPLFSIIMSGKSTTDYETVFNAISNIIDNEPIPAHTAHFDCEPASVKAFRKTPCFTNVKTKMCTFHVRQNVNAKVVSLSFTFACLISLFSKT